MLPQQPGLRPWKAGWSFISSLTGILIALAVFVNEPRCSQDIVRVTIFLKSPERGVKPGAGTSRRRLTIYSLRP